MPPKRSQISFITLVGLGTFVLVVVINVHTIFFFHSQQNNTENKLPQTLPQTVRGNGDPQIVGNTAGDSASSTGGESQQSLPPANQAVASSGSKLTSSSAVPDAAPVGAALATGTGTDVAVRKVEKEETHAVLEPLKSTVAVLYNRVDKCGSSSFVEMIRRASHKNKFKLKETKQYITFRTDVAMKTPAEVESFVHREIEDSFDRASKFVMHGHYYLMDPDVFRPAHGKSDVVFINQVRDPVKRVISRWNYLAYGPRPDPRTKVEAINLRKSMGAPTLNEFATHPNRAELMFALDLFPMRYYFCTAAERDQCTVDRAIANLERFTVVAVLERLDDSLAVMDYRLPGFFVGASKLFPDKKFKENENCQACEKPNNTTLANLRDMYKDDVKLFNACIEKLDRDYAALPESAKKTASAARQKDDPMQPLPAQAVTGVLYNRVDKCGSTSFVEMVSREKEKHKFWLKETKHFVSFVQGEGVEAPDVAQKKVSFELDYQLSRNQNFVFHGHFHLLLKPELESQVAYINLVRDPIKRLVSRWNYLAYGPRPNPSSKTAAIELRTSHGAPTLAALARHPDRARLLFTLDMFPMRYYFCTVEQRDSCTAKAAVANLANYMLVAVLERMDDSLAVLSAKLPAFFAEAKGVFPQKKLREVGECAKCEKPDEETLALLRELYAEDVTFYEACAKKLDNELQALKIAPSPS